MKKLATLLGVVALCSLAGVEPASAGWCHGGGGGGNFRISGCGYLAQTLFGITDKYKRLATAHEDKLRVCSMSRTVSLKVEQDKRLLLEKKNELTAVDKESARMIVSGECAATEELEAAYMRLRVRQGHVIEVALEAEVTDLATAREPKVEDEIYTD